MLSCVNLTYAEGLLVLKNFKFEKLSDIGQLKPPLTQSKRLLAGKYFLS